MRFGPACALNSVMQGRVTQFGNVVQISSVTLQISAAHSVQSALDFLEIGLEKPRYL